MLNLATLLENSAHKYANKAAFTFMDTSLSFAQVNEAANQVANALVDLGIESGDKVAMSCFNLPYFPIIYNGILKAGAIVVPLSVLLKSDEIFLFKLSVLKGGLEIYNWSMRDLRKDIEQLINHIDSELESR